MCLREIFKDCSVLQKRRCHLNLARFKDFSRTSFTSAAGRGSSHLSPEFQNANYRPSGVIRGINSLNQLPEERGHITLARFLQSSTTILRNPAAAA